ncbi:MAG: tetratricopeptide repeat protein [Bacteroidota bacterium]
MLHFVHVHYRVAWPSLASLSLLASLVACSSGPSPQEQALADGNQALAALELADAEEYFSRAIELDSTVVGAFIGRGQVRYVSQRYVQAVEDMDRALALDPELSMAYFLRGLSLLATDTPEQSLPDLARAGLSESLDMQDRVRAYRMRAIVFMSMEQFESSIEALTEAIALAPGNGAFYYERGLLKARVGQSDAAVGDLERFLTLQEALPIANTDTVATMQALQTLDSLRATNP